MTDTQQDELVNNILLFTSFFIAIACVAFQPFIPIPYPICLTRLLCKKQSSSSSHNSNEPVRKCASWSYLKFPLDVGTAPLIAVLFLTATKVIGFEEWKIGIIGQEGDPLQPYGIVVLFMALAYICTSLDETGLFQLIASLAVEKSKHNHYLLLAAILCLSSVLTVCTSNDIVILTLTPILCALADKLGVREVYPLVIPEFFMANVWSSLLAIGNPTNLIVATTFGISFLEYSQVMTLPSVIASSCVWVLSFVLFSMLFREYLLDPFGFTFDSAASAFLLEDIDDDSAMLLSPYKPTLSKEKKKKKKKKKKKNRTDNDESDSSSDSPLVALHSSSGAMFTRIHVEKVSAFIISVILGGCLALMFVLSWTELRVWVTPLICGVITFVYDILADSINLIMRMVRPHTDKQAARPIMMDLLENGESNASDTLTRNRNSCIGIWAEKRYVRSLVRLPWKVVPFVLSMFIIVEGIYQSSVMAPISTYLASSMVVCGVTIGSVYIIILSSICANLFNNIPMTILFSRIITHPSFAETLSASKESALLYHVTVFGLIFGSNYGANLTLLGSLAGILWGSILRSKNRAVTWWRFPFYGMFHTLLASVVAGIALAWSIDWHYHYHDR